MDPKIRAVSAPPGPISEQTTVTPGALPVTMSNTNSNGAPQNGAPGGNDKKAPPKLQKQKSFTVTTVYTPPSNPSKAMQKIRAKTRAAKAFKSALSVRKDFLLKSTIMFFFNVHFERLISVMWKTIDGRSASRDSSPNAWRNFRIKIG